MVKTTRTTEPRDMTGLAFYDIESYDVFSFCPGSRDASTPAEQVHVCVSLKPPPTMGGVRSPGLAMPPLVMRYHGPGSLDAHIEAMIEHRTYVFGWREYRNDFPVQPAGPQIGRRG